MDNNELAPITETDRGRRRIHRVVGIAVLLAVTALVVVTSHSGGAQSQTIAAKSAGPAGEGQEPPPDLDEMPRFDAPEGMIAVVDGEGHPRGFVPYSDLGPIAPSTLKVGGREMPGQVVTDADGTPTGYMVASLGFVSLDDAQDTATIDQLIAERDQRRADFLKETQDS